MKHVYELKLRARMGDQVIEDIPPMLFDNMETANRWFAGVNAITVEGASLEVVSATQREVYDMKSILKQTEEFFKEIEKETEQN